MASVPVGDVVFVRSPFSDLSQVKLRPALVLANARKKDMAVVQLVSVSLGTWT